MSPLAAVSSPTLLGRARRLPARWPRPRRDAAEPRSPPRLAAPLRPACAAQPLDEPRRAPAPRPLRVPFATAAPRSSPARRAPASASALGCVGRPRVQTLRRAATLPALEIRAYRQI